MLVAASLFILSFAQVDVVRLRSTLSTRRSTVERSNDDIRHLMQNGDHVVVLELAGFLFFGTANALLESIRSEIAAAKKPNVIILDFSRVRGLDASASHSLGKLSKACARAAVRLVYTGLSPSLEQAYLRGASGLNTAKLLPTLDVALRTEEDHLLARRSPGGEDTALPLGALASIAGSFPRVTMKPGDILLQQGAASTEMFVLLSGAMRAEISRPGVGPAVVARFMPGVIIGEIAFYSAVPRTATVIADEESVLLKIDAESLGAPDLTRTPAAAVHEFAATSLARRLRNVTLLLRDAEI